MFSFDASAIIYIWDNYPNDNIHFISLWDWFAEQVESKEFTISEVAFIEVSNKVSECGKWLKEHNIEVYKLSPNILHHTQLIKSLLEIEEEEYTKGVSENDLLIIAVAKEFNQTLVTEESCQNNLPSKKSNYKIPAVCDLTEVDVVCINFIDLIK